MLGYSAIMFLCGVCKKYFSKKLKYNSYFSLSDSITDKFQKYLYFYFQKRMLHFFADYSYIKNMESQENSSTGIYKVLIL